jgi:hypothetical protein
MQTDDEESVRLHGEVRIVGGLLDVLRLAEDEVVGDDNVSVPAGRNVGGVRAQDPGA